MHAVPISTHAVNVEAVHACFTAAIAQCPLMMKRWCGDLADTLELRAAATLQNAEKRYFQSARADLISQQAVIENGFASRLSLAMELDQQRGAALSGTALTGRSLSTLRFEELELMGDDQVQDTLDSARLQQAMALAIDAVMGEFSARISTAQGYAAVQADKNPLRPEVVSSAFLALLGDLSVQRDVRSCWLAFGASLLGLQLQMLYSQLTLVLTERQVEAAPYAGVLSARPGGLPRSAVAGSGLQAPTGTSNSLARSGLPARDGWGQPDLTSGGVVVGTYASREQLLTLDKLHRLMSGDYDASFEMASGAQGGDSEFDALLTSALAMDSDGQGFSVSVGAALHALADLKKGQQPVTDKVRPPSGARQRTRRLAPSPSAAQRLEKKDANTGSMGQALAIEVVTLMIEQLAGDQRLLPQVQQFVSRLKPALLRLATSDPRFFSDKAHPARQLLDTITAKSLAFSNVEAPGFAGFVDDINLVAGALTSEASEAPDDAQPFANVLDDFKARQVQRTRDTGEVQSRAVQALLQVERRHLLAEKIAFEIRARADFIAGNPAVVLFVTGPWAQVMAHERLEGERFGMGSPPAVYSPALTDLFWSMDVKKASYQRQRLVKLIPALLNVLRAGLQMIDYPPTQAVAFFEALMRIHQSALYARVLAPQQPAVAAVQHLGRPDLEKAPDTGREAAAVADAGVEVDIDVDMDVNGHQPWLARAEAVQSGFMALDDDLAAPAVDVLLDDLVFQSAPCGLSKSTAQPPLEPPHSAGMWVELLQEGQWLRAQLVWISPHSTLFMLSSEGGRSHSMTARMWQQLISTDRLRLICEAGPLSGALDGVARAAMRNSVGDADLLRLPLPTARST